MSLHSANPVFFYIRQLKSIKQSLTPEALKTLVSAFISSRIDYCNSVFTGISGQLLQRLQTIQNAGARRSQHYYDTDTASTALATNTATYSVQNGRVGVQMSAWYGSVLPVDLLHANIITRRSVSSTLCCIRTTLCSTHDD